MFDVNLYSSCAPYHRNVWSKEDKIFFSCMSVIIFSRFVCSLRSVECRSEKNKESKLFC